MLTIGDTIQRVQSLYSRGVESKDTRLTRRHIYRATVTARSTIIRNQANKNQKLSHWAYSLLPCTELVSAPVHECDCVPQGCTLLRTKYKLPRLISGIDGELIKSVTTMDGKTRFGIMQYENDKYADGCKYTGGKPAAYLRDGYLYVTVSKTLKAVSLEGLFEDIVEVFFYPNICGECEECEPCQDIMKLDFPLDEGMISSLLQLTGNELVIIFKQMSEDRYNNSTDEVSANAPNPTMTHQPQEE